MPQSYHKPLKNKMARFWEPARKLPVKVVRKQEVNITVSRIWCLLLLLLSLSTALHAQSFSVSAEVDRNQIGFGESLNLVITVSQSLSAGVNHRISIPAVSSIPGFDIAGTRSGQSTSFVNGVGQTQSQILYELVPQNAGKITIPAFSFKDPEGNIHSTKPIEVEVLPAAAEPEKPAEQSPAKEPRSDSANSLFRALFVLGLILAGLVALPFVISAFFSRTEVSSVSGNQSGAGNAGFVSDSGSTGQKKGFDGRGQIEDAIVEPAGSLDKSRPAGINFADAVARLKREFHDADSAFYRRYFELFRQAAISHSSSLTENMTADELFRRINETVTFDAVKVASHRLSADLELVMYANRPPARAFSAIDADANEIIRAITE